MRLAKALGLLPKRVAIVGCEPEHCHLGTSLSLAVNAAVERAVQEIHAMVRTDLCRRAE